MITRVYSRLLYIPWLVTSLFLQPICSSSPISMRPTCCHGQYAPFRLSPGILYRQRTQLLNYRTQSIDSSLFAAQIIHHRTGLATSLNLCMKRSQNSNAPSPQSSGTHFPKGMPLASSPVQQPLAASHPRAPRESHYEHAAIGSASGCSPLGGRATWIGVGNGYWNLTLSNRWFFQVLQTCCSALFTTSLGTKLVKLKSGAMEDQGPETQVGEPRVFGHKRDVSMSHSGNTLREGARQTHLLGVIL